MHLRTFNGKTPPWLTSTRCFVYKQVFLLRSECKLKYKHTGEAHLYDTLTNTHLHTFSGKTPPWLKSTRYCVYTQVLLLRNECKLKYKRTGEIHLYDTFTYTHLHTFNGKTPPWLASTPCFVYTHVSLVRSDCKLQNNSLIRYIALQTKYVFFFGKSSLYFPIKWSGVFYSEIVLESELLLYFCSELHDSPSVMCADWCAR